MKNKFISILLLYLMVAVTCVGATSGGPDSFGYIFKDSNEQDGPTYSWIEINATGIKILDNVDDNSIKIPINFTFNFYNNNYNDITVSTNGLLAFGNKIGGKTNQQIGETGSFHNFIAPFWDDLTTDDSCSAGEIYYQTMGTTPNRKFIIEWHNVKGKLSKTTCTLNTAKFEAILHENGEIKLQYNYTNFGSTDFDNGASATIGIEGPSGQGLQYSYNQRSLSYGHAILFSVSGPGDITPPGSVDNLRNITYEHRYINWTWTDPIDSDFDRVQIYIDNDPKIDIGKGIGYYNATGFEPNTEHTISTRTVDMSGNINLTWKNHTAKTAPLISGSNSMTFDINYRIRQK